MVLLVGATRRTATHGRDDPTDCVGSTGNQASESGGFGNRGLSELVSTSWRKTNLGTDFRTSKARANTAQTEEGFEEGK